MSKSNLQVVPTEYAAQVLKFPSGNAHPFHDDIFDLEEFSEALASIVAGKEKSCVIALDAPWGAGKTTFLDKWIALLEKTNWEQPKTNGAKGIPVFKFNAWETDFTDNPLLAFATELSIAFKKTTGKNRKKFKRCVNNIVGRGAGVGAGAFTLYSTSNAPAAMLAKEAVDKGVEGLKNIISPVSIYDAQKKDLESLHGELKTIALGIRRLYEFPLIVVIDELDRCKPAYAIKLLECIKHVFCVPNTVFVLGVNRPQIENAVKATYGIDTSAEMYLNKFIDYNYFLPHLDQFIYALHLFEKHRFSERFVIKNGVDVAQKMFAMYFAGFSENLDFKLRDSEKCFYKIITSIEIMEKRKKVSEYDLYLITILSFLSTNNDYLESCRKKLHDQQIMESNFNIPHNPELKKRTFPQPENFKCMKEDVTKLKIYKSISKVLFEACNVRVPDRNCLTYCDSNSHEEHSKIIFAEGRDVVEYDILRKHLEIWDIFQDALRVVTLAQHMTSYHEKETGSGVVIL